MSHVLFTGPITGTKTTADGTTYDVSPQVITVDSQEHALEIAHLIGLHYEAAGHPGVVDHETGQMKQFEYVRPEQLAEIVAQRPVEDAPAETPEA